MHLIVNGIFSTPDAAFEWAISSADIEELEEAFQHSDVDRSAGLHLSAKYIDDLGRDEQAVIEALMKFANARACDSEDIGWIGKIMLAIEQDLDTTELAKLNYMIENSWGLSEIMEFATQSDEYDLTVVCAVDEGAEEMIDKIEVATSTEIPDWLTGVDYDTVIAEICGKTTLNGRDYWVYNGS